MPVPQAVPPSCWTRSIHQACSLAEPGVLLLYSEHGVNLVQVCNPTLAQAVLSGAQAQARLPVSPDPGQRTCSRG